MVNFKLFQGDNGTTTPKLVAESGNFADLKPHIEKILRNHDRLCELNDAIEGLQNRGYYVVGWSSTMLTIEEEEKR